MPIVIMELDPCRFVPAALSTAEAAKRGLGAESGWDKAFGDGMSSCGPLDILHDSDDFTGPIKLTHPRIRTNVDIKVQEVPSPTFPRNFHSLNSTQTLHNMGIPKALHPVSPIINYFHTCY